MHERQRAIAILRQAREILIRRLSERILETEQELLDDAQGLTYCGEIDSIYEQVAVRLNHVNAMLANLPATEELPAMTREPPMTRRCRTASRAGATTRSYRSIRRRPIR